MDFKYEPVLYYDEPDRKVVDLRAEGVPFIPLASRTLCRYTRDSPGLHVHKGLGEIVYCVRGALSFETPEKIWPFLPGDVFVSGPDEPHTMRINLKGAFVYRLLVAWPGKGRALPGLTADETSAVVKALGNGSRRLFVGGPSTRPAFERLFRLYEDRSGDSAVRGMRLRACALEILLACADAATRARERFVPRTVQKWIERMANEPDGDFDIDEMANDAKLTPQRFRSVFKNSTGLPVHAYLMLCRIEGAKEMVRRRPNMSLLAVSQRFRFSSAPHFAASFKRIAGKTFTEYVKSLAKGKIMKKHLKNRAFAAVALASLTVSGGNVPRVWTSVSGMKTPAVFEESVKDCLAHGVEVMESHARDQKTCAEHLAICRRHCMKLQISVSDVSKADWLAKKTGRYELAVMSGGCYKGLAIDRNLFSFTAARHEIIVEPPVYSKGQAYAKHPHYYMLGDGHYFGGYVPTGKAEIVVPEKLFDGSQHPRIIPAKVETAPPGAVPENDSAADIADAREIRERRLVKLSFDLTDCALCRLDKVGIAVYWRMDDKDPKWRPERTCYSVFSPVTRERMRDNVRDALGAWTRANGGKFPSDVIVGLRLGDEIFNATGWLNCEAASFPLWDFSDSAIAAFRAASPAGVEPPRTWGAPEVYGPDACAQFLYLFHKACAEYLKPAVEEAHAASPDLKTFRNTTRGDAWSYGNDHDGTGQELLSQVLDMVHLDPYPVNKGEYGKNCIPGDTAYLSGFTRRYGKPLIPWMQAHQFPAGGLVHPAPGDIERMWGQIKSFAPDAIMWLGYNPSSKEMMTFPLGNSASWEAARKVHDELKAMPPPVRERPLLAVVRPYSARAVVCKTDKGYVHPADVVLREFAKAWSCDLGQQYDVFEIPPYEPDAERAKRDAELKCYAHVVSSVDWPGAMNVARGCSDKILSDADLSRRRAEFRRIGKEWLVNPRAAADDAGWEALRTAAVNRPRTLVYNTDGNDVYRWPSNMPVTVENFIGRRIRHSLGTHVSTVAYCPLSSGFGRLTCRKAGEPYCVSSHRGQRYVTADLFALGTDPLEIASAFCRTNGMEVFVSLRFNDTHDSAGSFRKPDPLFPDFKRDNPECLMGRPEKDGRPPFCNWSAVDFSHEKVRAHMRKFVRELVENYDVDGIEYDFNRHTQIFKSVALGGEASQAELDLMTAFMGELRSITEAAGRRKGRPIVVAMRAPDSVGYCRAVGIDLERWFDGKLVDIWIGGGYFCLNPWSVSAEFAHRHGVKFYASMDETRIPWVAESKRLPILKGRMTLPFYAARFADAMASGCDGVYVFNIEGRLLHDVGSIDPMQTKGRETVRFAVDRGSGGYRPSFYLKNGGRFCNLPKIDPGEPFRVKPGDTCTFEMFVAGDSLVGATNATAKAMTNLKAGEGISFSCNARSFEMSEFRAGVFVCPLPADALKAGKNVFAVTFPRSASANTTFNDFVLRIVPRQD